MSPEAPDAAGRDRRRLYDEEAPKAPEGPVDLAAALPGDGPLELDVGFGRGLSLVERAEVAPEARVVGVEVRSKWAYLASQDLARRGLSGRVLAWNEDVRLLLPRCGPEACLHRVFVHFPDPWWKKRHAKRRVVDDDFLDQVARLLRDGGDLFVQTDVEDRAARYRDLIAGHGAFEIVHEPGALDRNLFGARSNRERRADDDGLPVYRMLARRRPR